jgi:uncharacterized OsmC-like protein
MLHYAVHARRTDAHGSIATAKATELILDTGVEGRADAFNPAELLLASLAACMIKGIERVTPMLKFDFRGVEVRLEATRQDSPPKIISIDYEIIIDSDEDDRRLHLLHDNVRKYGTISNTIAAATALNGTLRRKTGVSAAEKAERQAEIGRIAAFSRMQLDAVPEPGADVLHEGP